MKHSGLRYCLQTKKCRCTLFFSPLCVRTVWFCPFDEHTRWNQWKVRHNTLRNNQYLLYMDLHFCLITWKGTVYTFWLFLFDPSSTSSIDTSNKYKTITYNNARRFPTQDQIAHKLVEINSVEQTTGIKSLPFWYIYSAFSHLPHSQEQPIYFIWTPICAW